MKRHLVAGLAVSGLVLSTLTGVHNAKADAPAAPEASFGRSVQSYEPVHKKLNLAADTADTVASWLATRDGQAQRRTATAGATPAAGTKRMWPAVDFEQGIDYMKEYTLRGVGKSIEVWVASGADATSKGIETRAGDCRASLPNYTTISDEQVQSLIHEYDSNILPKESEAFSVAPDRDGSDAPQDLKTSGLTFGGDGNKVVTLVDNIRDAAFYKFPKDRSGVAGFFSPAFNELTDRNIMTIDAEDWTHSTGKNPPHEPNQDPCKNMDGTPHFYEAVFAHEYQHLLMYYIDANEVTWVNEGLSMYAEHVTDYIDSRLSVNQFGYNAYVACFQGFRTMVTAYNPAPVPCGGPANSLTRWGDQGTGKELLADYGNAESFMLYLHDRFGEQVLHAMHRDGARVGLSSLRNILDGIKSKPKVTKVLQDFQLMNLLDRLLEQKGSTVSGVQRKLVTSKSLRAAVNLLNPAALSAVGAVANGADYLTLRGLGVGPLDGAELRNLTFTGDRGLPPLPVQWTVANQYPLPTVALPVLPNLPPPAPIDLPAIPPSPLDNPVLFSGNEPDADASIVFEADVPESNPLLTYNTVYNLEQDFDFGYTLISADGGKTYKSLRNSLTKETSIGYGLTGASPVPTPQVFDLSEYAGQKVLIGFRYVSDPLINNGGWAVDDIAVGGKVISNGTSIDPFRTMTQISPLPVKDWSLQLVGIDEVTRRVKVFRFSGKYAVTLTKAQIAALRSFPLLVAVIGWDDPEEKATVEAPYTVKVNGIGQAGGR
ncbi:immune inhibitor A domain-containing protein [Sporichthya sp.]|uniref:immune inhibitor A domain-containing protein n=1 Tax=Sporichthya sp. TaxID=65475 RepID=UPI0017FE2C92|nr:immune inhibitor A domain-containing protein [Sporichthya sp.]MBA3742302.1 immune inhibitor A [Sporichthya sp.]